MTYLVVLIVLLSITTNLELTTGQSCDCPPGGVEQDSDSLRAVYVLMRHGIRAPWTTYPLDPEGNNTARWPNGRSQLTDAGIGQAYNIGKFLKKRYRRFAKDKQKQVFLRSSAAQRCIDTISIVAKTLWPTDEDEKKSWQPMIFSLPKQIDSVLYEEPDCEHAEEEEQNNLKTKEVQDYESDPNIQQLYNFTAEKTGLPANMYSVTKAFDCIRCEKLNNLKSPDWATPEIYERMGDVLSKRLNFFYTSTKAQRLRAGPILADLKKNINNVINSKPEDKAKNIFIYGSHDFKIASVLSALGDPQPKYPPFAATIIFELHKVGDKNIVRAFYIDQTINWPYTAIKLNLNKCKRGTNPPNVDTSSPLAVMKNKTEGISRLISSKLSKLPAIELPKIPDRPELSLFRPKPEPIDNDCTFENFVNSVADLTSVDWRTECGLDCKYDPFKAAEENMGKT